jgi:hypothetical protein
MFAWRFATPVPCPAHRAPDPLGGPRGLGAGTRIARCRPGTDGVSSTPRSPRRVSGGQRRRVRQVVPRLRRLRQNVTTNRPRGRSSPDVPRPASTTIPPPNRLFGRGMRPLVPKAHPRTDLTAHSLRLDGRSRRQDVPHGRGGEDLDRRARAGSRHSHASPYPYQGSTI